MAGTLATLGADVAIAHVTVETRTQDRGGGACVAGCRCGAPRAAGGIEMVVNGKDRARI